MKFKFISILFFFFTAIVQTTSAAQTTSVPEDYFERIGLSASQPVKLTMRDDLTQKSVAEFEAFREFRHQQENKSSDFALIKSYILGVLKLDHMAISQIESWISKPIDMATPHKRALFLPLETLAGLLSIKAQKPILSNELEDYLVDARKKLDATAHFETLKYFATKALQFPIHELDGLNSWILSDLDPAMTTDTPRLLKCDFGLVLDVFSHRAGRDIRKEFDSFETDHNERLSRVRLREDLVTFFTQSGSGGMIPPSLSDIYANESVSVWQQQTEMMLPAVSKSFDISTILAEKNHSFLSGLFSNMDDRRRGFGRFIICYQASLVTEKAHPDLKTASHVTIQDNLLYQDGKILTTTNTHWALNPHEELQIYPLAMSSILGPVNHSHFFQQDDIGLPVACAGHIEVQNGKITNITNGSGHYMPSVLQLFFAVLYFHEKGVVDENLTVTDHLGSPKSLKDIIGITNMIKLSTAP